jgi:plastocyanin
MRILSTLILSAISIGVFAQTIDQVGFSFSPAVLAVDAGQTIMITIGSPHTFTEVTEEIWNANGNTPNGGFNFNAGTHELTLNTPGTYYYVCIPHSNSGMKGQIIVLDGSMSLFTLRISRAVAVQNTGLVMQWWPFQLPSLF